MLNKIIVFCPLLLVKAFQSLKQTISSFNLFLTRFSLVKTYIDFDVDHNIWIHIVI
jgi:hypothetical protein